MNNNIRPHTDTPHTRFMAHQNDNSEPQKSVLEQDKRTHASSTWQDPISSLPKDEDTQRVTEFRPEDKRHMQQDLHRDIPTLLDKDAQNQERLAQHRQQLQAAVPDVGTPANCPTPADQVPLSELEREDHFKRVRMREESTDDASILTNKATRGYL